MSSLNSPQNKRKQDITKASYLENRIILCTFLLYFDQMNRETRYKIDDEISELQLEYRRLSGSYFDVRQTDIEHKIHNRTYTFKNHNL